MSRAKDAINVAFVTLVQTQAYQELQVSQIVKLAGVARATFYLHFSTKEELLLAYIDDIFQRFYDDIESSLDDMSSFDERLAVKMFSLYEEERAFSQLLTQADVQAKFYRRFQGYLSRLFGRILRNASGVKVAQHELPYLIDYCAGGSLALLARWVENDFQPRAEEMGASYYRITMSGMLNVLKGGA